MIANMMAPGEKISQQLLLVGRERLVWAEQPLPEIEDGDVVVRTVRSAISVGSEYAWFKGFERLNDMRAGSRPGFPRRMGYESLGRVTASRSERAVVGDRVVATYGHKTASVISRDETLIRVPQDIPDEIAILSILSCEASRGAEKVRCEKGDAIAIMGAGVIGLLALHRLAWLGYRNIAVVDPLSERREIAKSFGATQVFSPEALPAAQQYASALECSSSNTAFRLLQRSMRRSASICILSDGNYGPLELDPLFHSNELTVTGSSDGSSYELYAEEFFAEWRENGAPLLKLFDRHICSSTLIQGFESMQDLGRPLKVMVYY